MKYMNIDGQTVENVGLIEQLKNLGLFVEMVEDVRFERLKKGLPEHTSDSKPTQKQIDTIFKFIEHVEISSEMEQFLKTAHKGLDFLQYSYLVGECIKIWNEPTDKQRAFCREMMKCPNIRLQMRAEMTAKMSLQDVNNLISKYIGKYNDWKNCTDEMRTKAHKWLAEVSVLTNEEVNWVYHNMTLSEYNDLKSSLFGEFGNWKRTEDELLEFERQAELSKRSERKNAVPYAGIENDIRYSGFEKFSDYGKKIILYCDVE